MTTTLVVNPSSAAGRTGKRILELERIASAALGPVEIRRTTALGDGIAQARAAVLAGATRVIAVGGDGTASEVVNGILEAGVPGVTFGTVPAGTGSDLVRTMQIPADWSAAFATLARRTPRPIDAMEGMFSRSGGEVRRYAINVIGLGMAGEVVARVNRGSKRLGGRLTFLGATLGALTSYTPAAMTLRWIGADGAPGEWSGEVVNAFVCNGQYCGGGMWTAPEARMDDGLLDLVVVTRLPLLRLALQTPHLYDGTLPQAPGVVTARIRSVEATVAGTTPVLADADGEQPGTLPASVRCIPNAMLGYLP